MINLVGSNETTYKDGDLFLRTEGSDKNNLKNLRILKYDKQSREYSFHYVEVSDDLRLIPKKSRGCSFNTSQGVNSFDEAVSYYGRVNSKIVKVKLQSIEINVSKENI